MGEVSVTYEELFDLLRSERTSDELQILEPRFYENLINYFGEKQKIIDDKSDKAKMFGGSEREKVRTQLENAKKIAKELIERREKKIIMIALSKARTDSDIIDTSALLSVEKEFFYQASALFSSYKSGVMEKIVSLQKPVFGDSEKHEQAEASVEEEVEAKENIVEDAPAEKEETVEEEIKPSVDEGTVEVKFKSAIPKFLGRDEKTYGPFEEEEVATISSDIADILVDKGKAEKV